MWDIPSYFNCKTTPNIASVGLHSHELAEDYNTWMYPDRREGFYNLHQEKVKEFAHKKRLLAKVEIGSGCLPQVELQFGSNQVTINHLLNLLHVT